ASAVSSADRDLILSKQLELNNSAGKQLIDHLLTAIPDGDGGIAYLQGVNSVVSKARDFGISLTPENQRQLLEHVQKLSHDQEEEVVTGIRSDSALHVLDANRLKVELYQAAND